MNHTFFSSAILIKSSCLRFLTDNLQIAELAHKISELKGKMKRPALKSVKISADAMLGALLGSKVRDFKANLKTVKKEEEKVRDTAENENNNNYTYSKRFCITHIIP